MPSRRRRRPGASLNHSASVANLEKDIAGEILRANALSAARLGLRFDRVVQRVLGDLRSFAETRTNPDQTVLVTISAPIRFPAKTVDELTRSISALLATGNPREDRTATLHGNAVRLRLVEHPPTLVPRLIGFVHNPDSAPQVLLDMAERWLRQTS